jgi:integrase
MLALIRHMFTMAAKWGYTPKGWHNPAWDIEPYPEKKRERMLKSDEIKRLGDALQKAENGWTAEEATALPLNKRPERLVPEPWQAIACYRLLLLTGARLGEIQTLRWDYIDFDRGVARLPDSKTGAKNLPLPAPALELLSELPRFKNNGFVLPGKKKDSHFIGLNKPWLRVRKLAGMPDLRLHDLRHAYASLAVANNESLYVVGAVLGHRHASTTQRYAHLASDPVTQLADRNAARIAGLLNSMPSAEIVPLKRDGRK